MTGSAEGGVEIRAPVEQTEGTRSQVLRWLKSVGDAVTQHEPLIELETDKVTVEVAAPGSGILQEILKQAQEDVGPGELLGRIGSDTAGAIPTQVPASNGDSRGPPASTGAPIFEGQTSEGQTSEGQTSGRQTSGGLSPLTTPSSETDDRKAANLLSPAVRRLLAEHSLEPAAIRGTGERGRITVQDVLQVVSAASTASTASGAAASGAAAVGVTTPAIGADSPPPARRVPHSAIRKRIAEHMVRSLLDTAPHVTTVFEADLSAVLRHRAAHRARFASEGVPLTLTAYFLRATVDAIRSVPETNSRWTDTALEVFDSVHIGVATALEDELVVPVLRHVDTLDLLETARSLHELISRAREHRLTPADVRGGTFTISNHGVSGSLLATPIVINQPQSAILGVGKLEKRVTVQQDQAGEDRFAIQPRCYVTLTIDHRSLDGHRANRFLQTFVERLAHWPQESVG